MDNIKRKDPNRFKFIPFSERIANINVDIFHRVSHRNEEEDSEEKSHFQQAIDKWTVQNRTKEWLEFKQVVTSGGVFSLPQVLNQKDKIAEAFQEQISKQTQFSLEPVLDLLVSFVKDIRQEFYQYYPKILQQLIQLLKSRDPAIVELTFICLAYIFKYLVRNLVKDLDKVLEDLAPLLDESHPDYVKEFAAQSFAFVARRVKDRKKFLTLVLGILQQKPQLISGCGKLITEIIHGIHGQPHSSSTDMLRALFLALGAPELPQQLLFELFTNVIQSYVSRIEPKHSNLFAVITDILIQKLAVEGDDASFMKSVKAIIKLSIEALDFRSGIHLRDPKSFVDVILKLLAEPKFLVQGHKLVATMSVQLLTSNNLTLPQDVAASLCKMMLEEPKEIMLAFVENICNYIGFQAIILPRVLELTATTTTEIPFDKELLVTLAKIVSRKSYETGEWTRYPLEFNWKARQVPEAVLQRIDSFEAPHWQNIEEQGSYVILLPHMMSLKGSSTIPVLSSFLMKIVEAVENCVETGNAEPHLFMLNLTLESFKHVQGKKCDFDFQKLLKALLPNMTKSHLAFSSLETLLDIMALEAVPLQSENLEPVRERAISLLTSPHHRTRVTALRMLLHLESLEGSKNLALNRVIQTCLNAEMVPQTIQTYREAVMHVTNLHQGKVNLQEESLQIPMRFLLGFLFCNFALLEEPIRDGIGSYIESTTDSTFVSLKEQLTLPLSNPANEEATFNEAPSFLADLIRNRVQSLDRPDYLTYKIRVWKALNAYPSFGGKYEQEVIDISLDYFRSQMKSNWRHAPFSIKNRVTTENDISKDEENEGELEEEEKPNLSSRLIKILSCEQFSVLTKLHSKHKETEIRSLCMDMLTDGDAQLRKAALECLLSRRTKKLQAYKANLLKFIDDSGFKEALVFFQLDKDTGAVDEAHRPMLIPIILRLLYSIMISSSATHRGNRGSATALRRTLVMRFLSGCHQNEIEEFLKMAFRDFELNPEDEGSSGKIADKMAVVNLESVPHPRKLLSGIHLTETVMEHLGGHLSDKLQKFLIQIDLSAAAIASGCLEKRSDIHVGYVSALKRIRNLCLDILAKVFDKFRDYQWSDDDIDAIFRVCIWPVADKLHFEGAQSPTSLLKLFSVWSQHPRLFKLLARHLDGDESMTPLSVIMQLLLNEQCVSSVSTVITNILANLVTLKEDDAMETDEPPPPPLELRNIRPVDTEAIGRLSVKEELNYGSQLLIPHVASILEYLTKQLAKADRKGLAKVDTLVLARVTELGSSPEHGDQLIGLLLKLMVTFPPKDEEVLVNTLMTVEHLMAIVSKPMYYVRPLAQLFSSVELIQGRKVLITSLQTLASRCEGFEEIVNIVRDLNAFDRRWIDQCDFNKRLDTFKLIRKLVTEGALSVDATLFVIHTCFFFLRFEKDLSLRDSTELCLKEVCPAVLKSVHENICDRELITETLLKHMRAGVQGKDERFKTSCISLLGVLARESASSHVVFKDLSVLTNAEDMEVDFFENIHHLQIYRRLRALNRFIAICKTLKESFAPRTLTQFILPLGTQFLCNETYAGKNTLVDAAIGYVAVVSRLLPWYQYQTILKYYLLKLRTVVEFQKQCVRLVVGILDSFHFDLSRAAEIKELPAPASDLEMQQDGTEAVNEAQPSVDNNEEAPGNEKDELEYTLGDELLDVSEEVVIDDTMEVDNPQLAVDVVVVLKPGAAARVQRAIAKSILEQLHKAIGQRTAHEAFHKVNKKALGPDRDEEDILRVPIAIALVKLLQKLPGDILDAQLPGIFTQLCTFLKSHLESVRRVTRETLQQIILAVGPDRLSLLLKEMCELLTKGFQVHVLVFTMHAVIKALQPMLRPGDVDKNLALILRVCSADLFGCVSEEKEVVRIIVKHKEARSQKSFNFLNLVAQFITDKCLMDLILPIKQVLSTRYSHKIHTKCRECLRQIVLGLSVNKFIPKESLFVFLYGAASETIEQLKPAPPPPPKKRNPKERPDSLLIAPEVHSRSISTPVKNNARSGAHILIEFGLHLLMVLLKQDQVKKMDLRPYLDPIVPVLRSALDSQHVKVTTLAFQCLTRLLKHDLPSLREHIQSITSILFITLHKFAAAGLSKGDNFTLVLAAFKMVSVVVRDVEYYTLSSDQLKALLLYAEQDIYDGSRRAVAFGLIKSVLQRRLKAEELHGVMLKVANLSISSDEAHVRTQARQTMLQYLMDYPLGKKIEDIIGFYIAQLSYEVESGRQSALEMIFSFINSFPEKTLQEQSALFFLTLGTRLVNDESPDCKKMVAAVIKGLLLKLDQQHRDQLFEMIAIWLQQNKMSHRRLAVQLAGIFVTNEKEDFERHLKELLPLLKKILLGDNKPGRFVKPATENELTEDKTDQLLYLVFVLLVKICANCPKLLTDDQHKGHVGVFVDVAQSFLCHEHEWVRVGASQFLGSVLSNINPSVMSSVLRGEESDLRFWDSQTFNTRLKSLILDHTAQFEPNVELNQDFTDQLMKNLVYFARVLKDVPQSTEKHLRGNNDDESSDPNLTLAWLVRRIRRIVNLEVAHNPSNYSLRTAAFMWIGAIAVCLTKEELLPVLYNLAAPIVREEEIAQGATNKSPIADLVRDVSSKLKKKVGVDEYAAITIKLQGRFMEKRALRKSAQAEEFVTDPERAVKRKLEKQQRKKENKKRKKEIIKGKKAGKYKGKKRQKVNS